MAAWNGLTSAKRDQINRLFANIGKAIAAFERTIMPGPTRFDVYADALGAGESTAGLLSTEELGGLRLFISKGNCTNCHNGPLLMDNHFHNTGVPAVARLPTDEGRAAATAQVLADPFNCLGPHSDAGAGDCAELKYMAADGEELVRAYKSPSLRGVAERPPYMHAGQFETLAEVLVHYNEAAVAPRGHSELEALHMTTEELAALEAFLKALDDPSGEGGQP